MFLNSATLLRILWWIRFISNLLPSFISLLWECNHPFAFFQSAFFFLPREKQDKGQAFLRGEGGGVSITIFSFSLRFFSLFPHYFSIFHTDLPSHLSFSCVRSKGWTWSSLLIYSFIFENKNHDWLFFPLIYLLVHTCFFHFGFLQVSACIFSCSAFCFSFLLCDYARSPGPPLFSLPSCQP